MTSPTIELLQEHVKYLREVSGGERPLISKETMFAAVRAWNQLWEASDFALPVPVACTGPDGRLLYTWDKDRLHLELEFIPGEPAEFFYTDRESGDYWGEDFVVGDDIPARVRDVMSLFA